MILISSDYCEKAYCK